MAASRWLAVLAALLAGCAGLDREPRAEILQAREPMAAAPAPAAPDAPAEPTNDVVPSAPAVEQPGPAKPVAAPAKAAVKEAAPAPAAAPARKVEEPAVAAKGHEGGGALDVTSLKLRLRDTTAIGVMAKLSLRKQMDELLDSFRTHYEGGAKTGVAALRKPYDALVMKVLDLLQEGDPSLARSISASREAIWGILSDRERFALLN